MRILRSGYYFLRVAVTNLPELKKQDGCRRELLGDGSDAEPRVRCVRSVPFQIGETITPVDEEPISLCNQHGAYELLVRHTQFYVPLYALDVVGSRAAVAEIDNDIATILRIWRAQLSKRGRGSETTDLHCTACLRGRRRGWVSGGAGGALAQTQRVRTLVNNRQSAEQLQRSLRTLTSLLTLLVCTLSS
jgi:hypothetical protein